LFFEEAAELAGDTFGLLVLIEYHFDFDVEIDSVHGAELMIPGA
jgi:hypothetical protein